MAKSAATLSLMRKGTTLQFNPSFDEDIIGACVSGRPERYGAEYLSKWRDDLSTWLSRDNDSFTAAISHRERHSKIVPPRIGNMKGVGRADFAKLYDRKTVIIPLRISLGPPLTHAR
jgi:hypothetical protein